MIGWIRDNFRTLAYLGAGFVLAVEFGLLDGYPSLPGWWPILLVLGVAVGGVGWAVGSMIADLLPEPPGHFLVAQRAADARGGAVYELNDEAWEQLEVKEGRLFPWEKSQNDVYEVREFRSSELVAVANWKGTKPASKLSSHVDPDEVMRQIRNLRQSHETEARYGQAIRNALPALLRTLDKWRAKDMRNALEGEIVPNFGDRSIDDMISEELPDEVLPDYLQEDEPDEQDGELGEAIEVLEADEFLDPVDPGEEILNDGGSDER